MDMQATSHLAVHDRCHVKSRIKHVTTTTHYHNSSPYITTPLQTRKICPNAQSLRQRPPHLTRPMHRQAQVSRTAAPSDDDTVAAAVRSKDHELLALRFDLEQARADVPRLTARIADLTRVVDALKTTSPSALGTRPGRTPETRQVDALTKEVGTLRRDLAEAQRKLATSTTKGVDLARETKSLKAALATAVTQQRDPVLSGEKNATASVSKQGHVKASADAKVSETHTAARKMRRFQCPRRGMRGSLLMRRSVMQVRHM